MDKTFKNANICEHLLKDSSGEKDAGILCRGCLNKAGVTLLIRGMLISAAVFIVLDAIIYFAFLSR